jgi:pyrimidine-nucleoside phosphorylase
MRPYDVILRKRNGAELSEAELAGFVDAFTRGDGVADYQAAALLMAIYFRGMTKAELGHWTRAMLHSGIVLDLSDIAGVKADKHSTGGVGDKVSLALAPLVAAAGVPVPMISGRGLGHTGGTLDKLEAIPGFRTDLTIEQFKRQVAELGCALIGQTAEIAPADKKLYALRDVTATVDCIPLIASSIMSKKLAEGIDVLVLDVKTGRGAFMARLEDARVLARTMIDIGDAVGVRTVAHITAMDQPLGRTVGNALEVVEAVETLRGAGPDDFLDVTLTLGAEMLVQAGVAASAADGLARLQALIDGGQALDRLRRITAAQGGDARAIDDLDRLPRALHRYEVRAPRAGVIQVLDALVVGQTARALGAGRQRLEDVVDPAAGLVLDRKVGDGVDAGDRLATLHASSPDRFAAAAAQLLEGIVIADEPVAAGPLLIERLTGEEGA